MVLVIFHTVDGENPLLAPPFGTLVSDLFPPYIPEVRTDLVHPQYGKLSYIAQSYGTCGT